MPEPTVVCVMLTANRPEMARQAVECFRRQTYAGKRLLIYNTMTRPDTAETIGWPYDITVQWIDLARDLTIGELRNKANDTALNTIEHWQEPQADILCHWDDDDYSAPQRIAEQVSLLQASGAEACGYNSMLFWREPQAAYAFSDAYPGEAWLYTGSILGTSLCYWRTAWERKHFEAMSNGEDTRFLMGMKTAACSSIVDGAPRMVARIHSGNTSNAYRPDVMRAVEKQGGEWKRVSAWDEHCRKAFA